MDQMINLQDLYLLALQACAEGEKLETVLQQTGEGQGRLWLVAKGSTVPHAWIGFKFSVDDVALMVQTRDQREIAQVVKFAEGIDGFLPQLQRCLRAGKLAAPKKVA